MEKKRAVKPSPKPEPTIDELNPIDSLTLKNERFCRFLTQNSTTFGNATNAYAAAYDYDLDSLSREAVYENAPDLDDSDVTVRTKIEDSPYDLAVAVCASNGSRLLRNDKVQARCRVLLLEYVKSDVVDSERAKLIMQDDDLTNKLKAIVSYDKLHGRIIDKTQVMSRLPFGESDLGTLIATLPEERQDYFYGVIKQLIDEAELQRRAVSTEGGGTR